MEYQLDATCLFSKFGFERGNLFSNYEDSALHDFVDKFVEGSGGFCNHDLLVEIVEHFLLPMLVEPVEVSRIETCHNPIRAVGYERLRSFFYEGQEMTGIDLKYHLNKEVVVTVTTDDIIGFFTSRRERQALELLLGSHSVEQSGRARL